MLLSDVQKYINNHSTNTNDLMLEELTRTASMTSLEGIHSEIGVEKKHQEKKPRAVPNDIESQTGRDANAIYKSFCTESGKDSKTNHVQVDNLSNTFFNVKNFIFKVIVPVVLFSTFIFIYNLPSDKASFYKRPFINHGNTISNHDDGISDKVLSGKTPETSTSYTDYDHPVFLD